MAEKKKPTKKVEPKPKAKMGRPTKYTEELAKKICRAIATCTDGLEDICRDNPDFPVKSTIYEWRYDHPQFSEWYAIARAQQVDLLAEEMDAIAKDGTNDWMERQGNNEGWQLNGEAVARSRLRIDTIKWKACKLIPKVYGDKQITEQTVTIKHEDRLKELK